MTICLNVCENGVYDRPYTTSILQYGPYTKDYKEKTDSSGSRTVHIIYISDQMQVHMANIPAGRSFVSTPYLYSAKRRKTSIKKFLPQRRAFQKVYCPSIWLVQTCWDMTLLSPQKKTEIRH